MNDRHQHPNSHRGPAGEAPGHDSPVGSAGHGGHGGDHVAMFRRLFWIHLLLALPTVLASAMFADLTGETHEMPGTSGSS